jgi:ABC-type lipoprotein export system ATPase subunit
VTGWRRPDPEPVEVHIEIDPEPLTTAATRPQVRPVHHRPITACSVVAESVSYSRGGRVILDEVRMVAVAGESIAVTGPSGSGKSTLLALLAGLEQPDAGIVRREPRDSLPRRDGVILQGYGLASVLTAAENVEVPLQAGALGRLAPAEIRDRAAAMLAAVGLSPVADHLIEELSGGQQQRVAVARALVADPAIVFADEITAELDHEWKDHVVDLVLDVAHRGGLVVLATHDPDVAGRCSNQIRLTDGRVST